MMFTSPPPSSNWGLTLPPFNRSRSDSSRSIVESGTPTVTMVNRNASNRSSMESGTPTVTMLVRKDSSRSILESGTPKFSMEESSMMVDSCSLHNNNIHATPPIPMARVNLKNRQMRYRPSTPDDNEDDSPYCFGSYSSSASFNAHDNAFKSPFSKSCPLLYDSVSVEYPSAVAPSITNKMNRIRGKVGGVPLNPQVKSLRQWFHSWDWYEYHCVSPTLSLVI